LTSRILKFEMETIHHVCSSLRSLKYAFVKFFVICIILCTQNVAITHCFHIFCRERHISFRNVIVSLTAITIQHSRRKANFRNKRSKEVAGMTKTYTKKHASKAQAVSPMDNFLNSCCYCFTGGRENVKMTLFTLKKNSREIFG
jgi:hypothetical protein